MQYIEDIKDSFLSTKYRNVIIAFTGVAVCALVVTVAITTLTNGNSPDAPNLLKFSPLESGRSEITILKGDRFDEDVIIGNVLELGHRVPLKVFQGEEDVEVDRGEEVEDNSLEPVVVPEEAAVIAKSTVTTVEPKVATVEPKVATVKPQVTTVKQQVTTVKQQVTTVKPQVTTVEPQVTTVEPQVTTVKPQVTTVKPTVATAEPTPPEPVVSISGQGRIRGTTLKTRKNRSYHTFYNIPYARSPTGSYRFEIPRAPRRWYRTRDGTKPGPQCMQRNKHAQGDATIGQEDCLYLNVHTPELPKDGSEHPNLPVLFYIHGGGVYGNGTRYKGTYLLDERVILVTLEYRIGAFGGFTTGTSDYPGNLDLKDQVMALKWVQKNIQRFGGDPKRVLIFGNSSGSYYVHAHMLSAMSSDLFHYAVMQSGSTIGKNSNLLKTKEVLHDFLTEVNCAKYENRTTRRLIECLKGVKAKNIALSLGQEAYGALAAEPIPANGDLTNVFLPDHPWNLLNAGVVNNVPVIIGMNSMEMITAASMLTNNEAVNFLNKNWDTYLPTVVGIPDDSNHTVAHKFREVYFGDEPISNATQENFVNLLSDQSVHTGRITGMIQADQSPGSVYFYWLNKSPPRSYGAAVKEIYPALTGAAHADELQYLFEYDDYPVITTDSPWFPFSEMLVRIWVSFAATGRPISPSTEWLPIDSADNGMKWFQLDDELKYVEPFTDRMLLWDDYVTELYEIK
ncbi:unnamed protein product [Allacma fusca]|uniref:Carboxylesterase type B domain-containing protein n=1 Tax=Allacma fusca TaxID=39272 RepID=A0A8J2PST1_9HEXA|nr:unnamed protein product [Allacma fusca]